MVAISLYRGNLHRVPDVPRRWLMPTPKISLKDFKSLLSRRNNALSRLRSSTLDPNPNSTETDEPSKPTDEPSALRPPELEAKIEETPIDHVGKAQDKDDLRGGGQVDGEDNSVKPIEVQPEKPAPGAVGADGNLQVVQKPADAATPNAETINNVDALDGREKRKREVEEKLRILNAKKHNLVQVLKQILNAEEELKRRNTVPGMAIRPSGPLHGDATNDSGSMNRHIAGRMGSEPNLGGDLEGGEAEDVSNHNVHSRHMLRMSSTSPCSESPLRRPNYAQHNVVPHPSRTILVATGSPSRFAPTGHQLQPGNPPTVSVSGTNYIASSPSPAASGGTSVLRDAQLPSPWN